MIFSGLDSLLPHAAAKQFAEKLDLHCSAPKGASQFQGLWHRQSDALIRNARFSANCKAAIDFEQYTARLKPRLSKTNSDPLPYYLIPPAN